MIPIPRVTATLGCFLFLGFHPRNPGVNAFLSPSIPSIPVAFSSIQQDDSDVTFPQPIEVPPVSNILESSQTSTTNLLRNETNNYSFWGENNLQNFNMDLQNMVSIDPQKAYDAIQVMQQLYQTQPEHPYTTQPAMSSYNIVLEGFLQCGLLDDAQKLLTQLENNHDAVQNNNYDNSNSSNNGIGNGNLPSDLMYLLTAQALAEDAKDDFYGRAAQKAQALLRKLQEIHPNSTNIVKMYCIVVEGWCKRAGIHRGALRQAERLLGEMERAGNQHNDTSTGVHPSVMAYTSYIGGLARSKDRDMGKKAEGVLERMRQHGISPDAVAYTSVLNCWARVVSRREKEVAALRAVRILDEMERLYARQMYHTKPSLVTYATAIRAVGNSLDPSAAKIAQDILRRMYDLSRSGAIANLRPTTSIYNAVLNALNRVPGNSVKNAQRAEQILNDMFRRVKEGERDVLPDVRTWAAVIRGWAVAGTEDAAINAQRILQQLIDMYEEGETSVRPNYVCYTTVMGAWGKSPREDALDRMEELLRLMEEGYEETQEPDIRPNTVSYVTAIDAFVRRDEANAAERAQKTVDRMMRLYAKNLGHVRPTRIIFNTLINAWSRSKHNNAANNAEKIFKWMEAQYRAGDALVRPDEVSLCAVLNAWANNARDGGAERAQQIFQHMQSMPLEERGFHISVTMPNIVIKALARSGREDAVEEAEKILNSLEHHYSERRGSLRPDVTTYSSVINCCAYYQHPEGREKALTTALTTFWKVCNLQDERPNNIVFGTTLKAISNLHPAGEARDALVRKLLDQACEEGMVDAFVLSQVKYASHAVFRDLVEGPCGIGDGTDSRISTILRYIPEEWGCHVVEG